MVSRFLFVVYILLTTCFFSCFQKKAEDVIYLLPKNFEGNVFIIYGQADGVDTLYEGKSRLLTIDTSGILKTKFPSNYGSQNNSFYYVDSTGRRYPLNYLSQSNFTSTNNIVVSNKETGNNIDKKNNQKRHFEMLTVGKERNIDSIINLRSAMMWNKVK